MRYPSGEIRKTILLEENYFVFTYISSMHSTTCIVEVQILLPKIPMPSPLHTHPTMDQGRGLPSGEISFA